ncbi:Oxysterol-binding protein-domain-containing protein [Geopyxis carbonaria]|nr:Oxysterol-binding protein-domain-containing protein [Geopyxis carbonaria]
MNNSGVLVGGAKSVEETVRTFRLYEALRNGDTAAISRAIRETLAEQNAPRKSMSSLSGAGGVDINKSSILHLAVQCAELPVIEYILSTTTTNPESTTKAYLDINGRDSTSGNTPLHVAAHLGRVEVVNLLLKQPDINDSIHNYHNRTSLEVARTPQIFQILQLARSLYLEKQIEKIHNYIALQQYDELEKLLDNTRVKGLLDVNSLEPPDAPGSTLLHEAAKRKDTKLIQLLLMHGADPFRRDKKGKLPQDVTKDERTKGVLKKSPAAVAAARGIEERAVLGSSMDMGPPGSAGDGQGPLGSKETREMKGYLKKWTNYTGGYKLRWFVLEEGVLSYYKNQEDIGSACRGAINMKIAKLQLDPQDKQRFEIHGKGSVKYHLKANHIVEAKRWYWTLNNSIQHAKDEARQEQRLKNEQSEMMGRLREQQDNEERPGSGGEQGDNTDRYSSIAGSIGNSDHAVGINKRTSFRKSTIGEHDMIGGPLRARSFMTEDEMGAETHDEDDQFDDDDSSHDQMDPPSPDALALAANSARLQLDLLSQVVLALQFEHASNPELKLSDSTVVEAMSSYEIAVGSLKSLIGDLLSMSKERDSYWKYRLEKETTLRKLWEENMTKLAEEQEQLEDKVHGERERRKKTKRVLREVLRKDTVIESQEFDPAHDVEEEGVDKLDDKLKALEIAQNDVDNARREREKELEAELSDSDSDDGDQFFDAIDAGELEVVTEMPTSSIKSPAFPQSAGLDESFQDTMQLGEGLREKKLITIKSSFVGYEDPPRSRLGMDEDNRPKISLWGILKSMIGKDMTKMTLPVSFNEPTSLLQRVAEDMEYTDLLDTAADRPDPAERMVYVAAFAASEYSSTTGRVAKPFNPLLGETYEYCRPDKNYRFFVEQVSHHPPIGAAHGEGEKWDYWGESAVKSKFYGKSFDINPLGTWFLRLRTVHGTEELYTWKKVTTSVVGIITGSPTVDNYGLMEIKNHTTGDVCHLDFKARGWRAANAFEVKGRVCDRDGFQAWSIGGRWNDKIYARLSPGYDANVSPPPTNASSSSVRSGNHGNSSNAAFLVWENHPRPPAPFSLTPFAITLNALPDNLRPVLCPTDTRLRPDQRAMEEGQYDLAATEKNRVEEKQRATRRRREEAGEEYQPRWFKKGVCEITGEEYWVFDESYWTTRSRVAKGETKWKQERVEEIFYDDNEEVKE